MTQTQIYYRLRVRDEADATDIIVLSSFPDDDNALVCEAPEGDGQNIDPLAGTMEVGSYTWMTIDRFDSGDTYTITSVIADADARNQLLSHKCIGEYSADGASWLPLHTGYLNDLKLGDAKTYTFIVGDTDRRERDSKLFKTITDTFDKVSNIIGGPVEATAGVAYQGTPVRAWGPLLDHGPARFIVIANPANLVDSTNRVTLSLVGANLPPRYLGFQGVWNGKVPNPAEYIDQQMYEYFEADADGIYATTGAEQSQPWGSFPQIEVKLRKTSDSSIIKTFPIAQATKKASSFVWFPGGPDFPVGDEKALVANSNDWLIIAWDVATMGAQPSVGTTYDGWVRPKVISEKNPLHLGAHPIDIHTAANDELGIAWDSASVASTKTAIGPLYAELRITSEVDYADFTAMLKGACGYAVRYNSAGEQEFIPTRSTQPSSVATITPANCVGDEMGDPKDVIFRVSESTSIKGVDFKLKQFRLWNPNVDSASDRPVDGIIAEDLVINGTRRDESVKGDKIITYDVPGMILLEGGATVLNQPFALRQWIEDAGDVIIDRAGWGWIEYEYEIFDTVAGEVGDYHDLELPHQVNAKTGQDPITQRGGTRKVQIVSVTRTPGTKKIKAKDAGNLAQDAPEAPDNGGAGDVTLPVPELTLAPSDDAPFTIATVTETNVSELQDVGADTELQYLVQTATPSADDNGDNFGPLLSSTGADTIDAPAILSGQTIWVRGRATIVAAGQVGEWSAWISITLGPDDDGTGGNLDLFTLALQVDSAGVLSATAGSVVAEIIKIYFLAGAAGGSAPLFADVVAETPDSTPPFAASALATMAEGETRTVGAVGEDALGNRTTLVTASIMRSVNTGAGAGTPGNTPLTLISGPPAVVWNVGATLREPRAFKQARKYWNTSNIGAARIQMNVWTPASAGSEVHWVYTFNGTDFFESGVFVRCDRERFPEPGDFLPLAAGAIGENILFGLATKNGDGLSLLKVSDVFIEPVSSATPPEGPPETPGGDPIGVPSGGALGNIVLNLDARQLTDNADLDPVSEWLDISGFGNDAEVVVAFADGGIFYEDHFGDGTPAMGFNTSGPVNNNGINTGNGFAFPIPDQDAFTYYLVGGDFEGLGSDDKNWANASLLNNHSGSSQPDFGSSMRADGRIVCGVGENASVATSASRTTAGSYDGARRDVHTFVRQPVGGHFWWSVNGTQDTPTTDSSTGADLTTTPLVGLMCGGGGHFAKGWVQHVLCYDTVHDATQVATVVAALNAIWTGGAGGGSEPPPSGGDGGEVPPGGGGDTGGTGLPTIADLKGFGTATAAGRAGTLYRVTNRNDSGAGSLRAALEATGPRVVCFEVSGTIDLSSKIVISSPFITVAGQTAPSPGILVKRYGISIRTHDVLIQHLRVRTGDLAVVGNNDAIEVLGPGAYNVVVDHCSTSWSTDENMSTWFTGAEAESSGAHDVTFNRCIISENFGSGGVLLGDFSQRVGMQSCLLAHNVDRNPYFKGAATGVFVNNVVYDWNGNQASYIADPENRGRTLASIVGNAYKRGLSTDAGRPIKIYPTAKPGTLLYVSDNRENGSLPGDPWDLVNNAFGSSAVAASAPVWPDGLVAIASSGVQADVLGNVGAYAAFYDSVDSRIVADVTAGTGTEISSQDDVGGFPSLANNTRTLESAGMPADTTTDTDADGYTDFEDWLATMAASVE